MASIERVSTLLSQREFGQAKAALRKLLRQKTKAGVDWTVAIGLAHQLADHDAALTATQNWRAGAPNDPERVVAEITALGTVAKHKEAAKLAKTLQKNSVVAADGFYLEAFYVARFGEREKAIALCREALDRRPDQTFAWEHLALLDGFTDPETDIAKMVRVEQTVSAPDQAQAICFALGRAYDRMGEYEKAFHFVSKAAQLRRGPQPFDIRQVRSFLDSLKTSFSMGFISDHEVENAGSGAVFILSPPRSGSTLLEQIISSAQSVKPTSEHAILRNASIQLGGLEPASIAAAASFKREAWRKIGQSYFDGLRRRFGASKVYTDKSLTNYCYAGLIRLLFPKAKFIWLRRDPKDVAWSCFRSRLNGAPWAESLEATCEFLKAHEEICGHWAKLFKGHVLDISYEQLVSAPDETTRQIFEHIEVERPSDWQDFHTRSDPVATNSLAQVREPLNTKGIGAWRRYEQFLKPVYDRCGV